MDKSCILLTYVHLHLDEHEILIANGAQSESWLFAKDSDQLLNPGLFGASFPENPDHLRAPGCDKAYKAGHLSADSVCSPIDNINADQISCSARLNRLSASHSWLGLSRTGPCGFVISDFVWSGCKPASNKNQKQRRWLSLGRRIRHTR